MRKIINAGDRFGALVAVSFEGRSAEGRQVWRFVCTSCGDEVVKEMKSVTRSRGAKSCGKRSCMKNKMNGLSKKKIYFVWKSMLARCYNVNHPEYKRYGERGITVCDKWHSLDGFIDDMGNVPDGMYFDKADNNKGYCKENCRWVSKIESCQNTRLCKAIVYKGVAYVSIRDAAKRLGIPYSTFNARYKSAAPTK
jgi:transposase-like protein